MKNIGTVTCGGSHNIPDGEVFTCPVRDSVQGHVFFNAPTIYQGVNFDGVRLEFKDGKVVKATGNPEDRLNEFLDADEGARYIGEFSLAFNPHILNPMRDILFDEKISGSFHFTPGQAYEDADNGNKSQVHWDMVSIQRPEWGGGEIFFDGELVRRDGLFVVQASTRRNSRRSTPLERLIRSMMDRFTCATASARACAPARRTTRFPRWQSARSGNRYKFRNLRNRSATSSATRC